MKIYPSKEWCMASAEKEKDCASVEAGGEAPFESPAPPSALLSRVALQCAEAISYDHGPELNARRLLPVLRPYIEALERIAQFPIHSEPVGGAGAMQDIAIDAARSAANEGRDK